MPSTNTIKETAKPFVERIENLHADLETKRGTYMAECKVVREDIKQVYIDAKDAGCDPTAIKSYVKSCELERRKQEIAAVLEPDTAASYEQLIDAFGPLGIAAARSAGFDVPENQRDLRPGFLRRKTDKLDEQDEAERASLQPH
jgi:uncharacterized protein (UPF0335 family)